MNLSFCSGYLKVNLFMIRCFEPDSIALMNPLAVLALALLLVEVVVLLADVEGDFIIYYCTPNLILAITTNK